MTLIDTTPERPPLPNAHPDAWGELRSRSQELAHRVAERAIELAADEPETYEARPINPASPHTGHGNWLRYVPPVAALGVAAVLQVVAMTDLVGGGVAKVLAQNPQLAEYAWTGYLAGLLLGIAVASCVEGGAAYLMDLYDRHLMARDSTWLLRVGMVAYVAASAGLLHWWLAYRHLPELVSWVLAGMSGLALFLWSRGSRWANRVQMRESGHLDPAMPKLPMSAKVFHPWRWLVTLYLTSWTPAETPEEARRRYDEWAAARAARKHVEVTDRRTENQPATPAPEPTRADLDGLQNTHGDDAPETDPGAAAESETAAQKVRQDTRTAQEIEDAVRAVASAWPKLSRNKIAKLASTSATNVRRILGPVRTTQPEQSESAPSTTQEAA